MKTRIVEEELNDGTKVYTPQYSEGFGLFGILFYGRREWDNFFPSGLSYERASQKEGFDALDDFEKAKAVIDAFLEIQNERQTKEVKKTRFINYP